MDAIFSAHMVYGLRFVYYIEWYCGQYRSRHLLERGPLFLHSRWLPLIP